MVDKSQQADGPQWDRQCNQRVTVSSAGIDVSTHFCDTFYRTKEVMSATKGGAHTKGSLLLIPGMLVYQSSIKGA
jgi:hypothetical protein